MLIAEVSEVTATALVDDTTFRFIPPDVSRITHPVAEGRSRAEPGSHTQRTGVLNLIDEDLLDWNIFLDRTSSTTALVLSVRII